jgi:hypothetical protein
MKFSYDRAWADAVSMAQRHSEILTVLAGMFLLIPNFIRELFLPVPKIADFGAESLNKLEGYFAANIWPLLALNLLILLGVSAILGLLLDARKPTVAQALTTAFVMLPSILVLNMLTNFMIGIGLVLLALPGIYLLGRLSVATSWQMASRAMNPLAAINQSFALTRSLGWRIAGFILLITFVAAIAGNAVSAVTGVFLAFLTTPAIAVQISAFVSAITAAITLFVSVMISAAIYRQLTEAPKSGT